MLFFTKLTALLPLPVNRFAGYLLGTLLYFSKSTPYRITMSNLSQCFPALSSTQLKKLCRESLIETGKMLTENGILFLSGKKKPLTFINQVHGLDELNKAIANDKGVILAVPHLGSWELTILYCSDLFKTTVLYRPLKPESFDRLVFNARQRYGATLVPTDNNGVRALFKAMKNKELAIILPDHEPKWGGGIFAPFFQHPAYTSTLIPKLAEKTGATVLICYMKRLQGSKGYDLHFEPIPDFQSQSIDEMTSTINLEIEKVIKETPQQYLWIYRRFRTQPDKQKNIYARK